MKRIIEHIEHLISSHDCVILPTIGGFVSRFEASSLSSDGSTIFPPSRQISFNSELKYDDRLLAVSIARKEQVSVESATSMMNEGINEILFHLNSDKEISLGRLGRLYLNKEGKIVYTPTFSGLIFKRYAILSPIRLTPIAISESASRYNVTAATTLQTDTGTGPGRISRTFKKVAKVVASIAVLLTIGIILTTTFNLIPEDIDYASFAPTVEQHFVLKTPPSIELTIATPPSDGESIVHRTRPAQETAETAEIAEEIKGIEPKTNQKRTAATSGQTEASTIKYNENPDTELCYLVVASMPSRERAEKYIRQKHDTTLSIIKMDNHYRVVAASGTSEEEVMTLKATTDISSKYPKAWATKKAN